ncbi:MAG: ABC transporter permease subunit, partial [Actinomycetota bacterium]
MERFLQAIIQGLTSGGVYALIALAFSIVYMTTRVINFAQGEVLMIGAYVYFAMFSASGLGLPWPAALGVALIAAMIVGLVVHLIAIAPLGKFDPNTNIGWIHTTLSVSLILVEVVRNVAGEQAKRIDPI